MFVLELPIAEEQLAELKGEAPAVHAHPLTNDATMVIPHTDLERFLAVTGHEPRVIDVPAAARAREAR